MPTPPKRLAALALLVGCSLARLPAAGAEAGSERTSRFREAVARHPEDPDLAWGLALSLLRDGHPEAERRLREHERRWPGRRPEAGIHLGRLFYESGRLAEALAALDRALALDATQAEAHLFRGLVLRRLGRRSEADLALAESARLSPGLRGEVARLLAPQAGPATRLPLDGDRDERGAAERSAARRAPPPGVLYGFAATGLEADTNPQLEERAGPGFGDGDLRGVWETGLHYRHALRERAYWGTGYRYRGWRHADTHEQDRQSHEAMASTSVEVSEGVALRAFALGGYDQREGSSDRWLVYGRPSLHVRVGPRLGTAELFASVEYADYLRDPDRDSLVLDGFEWAVGLRHRLRVPVPAGSRATLGLRYGSLQTEAGRDPAGFASPYDSADLEGSLGIELQLGWQILAEAATSLGWTRYRNRNVVDFEEGGSGRRRRDLRVGWGVALRRPLGEWLEVELAYRGAGADSNVAFYDYTRHVLGFELGVALDLGRTIAWRAEDR